MPATISKSLDADLSRLLETDPSAWSDWFYPTRITRVLTKLAQQIENVNFFESDYEITTFYTFLEAFIKSNPTDSRTLRLFDRVCQAVNNRITHQTHFDGKKLAIVNNYLKLWRLMLNDPYRKFLNVKEITFNSQYLRDIIYSITRVSPLPSDFIDIYELLQRSFDIPSFLNGYVEIMEILLHLAKRETQKLPSGELISDYSEVFKQFFTLGDLGNDLKYYAANEGFNYTLPNALAEIRHQLVDLYAIYKPYVQKDSLDFIVFKKFIQPMTADESNINPSDVCAREYAAYCRSDYPYFTSHYICPAPGSFVIKLESRNLKPETLASRCASLRQVEIDFFTWLRKIGITTKSVKSHYIYRLSENRSDFPITTNLFENSNPGPFTVGQYFSKGTKEGVSYGIAYSFAEDGKLDPVIAGHEYFHHLFGMAIGSPWQFKPITEGMAEVFGGGFCNSWHVHNLKAYSNDTQFLEQLSGKGASFDYFNHFKTSLLFVNYKTSLLKALLMDLQANNKSGFKEKIAEFSQNSAAIKAAREQFGRYAELCSQFAEQNASYETTSPFLTEIKKQLKTPVRSDMPNIATNPSSSSQAPITSTQETRDPDRLARKVVDAIYTDNYAEADRLFRQGANPKWSDPKVGNLLHFLFYYRKFSPEMARLLVQFQVEVNARNLNGFTPYQMALARQSELEKEGMSLLGAGRPRELEEQSKALETIKYIITLFRQSPTYSIQVNLFTQPSSSPSLRLSTSALPNDTLNRFITSDAPTVPHNSTEVVVYKPSKVDVVDIIVPLPLFAFFGGALSGGLTSLAGSKKEKYPRLPAIINYGLRPGLLSVGHSIYDNLMLGSASSIGIEGQWGSLGSYLLMNYAAVGIVHPVYQKIDTILDKKIANRCWKWAIKMALPTLTYMLCLNPGLFVSEEFVHHISLMIIIQLFNGMLFQLGECLGKNSVDYISKAISGTANRGNKTSEQQQDVEQALALRLLPNTNTYTDGREGSSCSERSDFNQDLEKFSDIFKSLKEKLTPLEKFRGFNRLIASELGTINNVLDQLRKDKSREMNGTEFKLIENSLNRIKDCLKKNAFQLNTGYLKKDKQIISSLLNLVRDDALVSLRKLRPVSLPSVRTTPSSVASSASAGSSSGFGSYHYMVNRYSGHTYEEPHSSVPPFAERGGYLTPIPLPTKSSNVGNTTGFSSLKSRIGFWESKKTNTNTNTPFYQRLPKREPDLEPNQLGSTTSPFRS
jgi:hypothetical protein